MNAEFRIVRSILARHAGRSLESNLRLERDLDLTPLELVLIAMEVEEAVGTEIPVEGLADVETVADLMQFFLSWIDRARRLELHAVA